MAGLLARGSRPCAAFPGSDRSPVAYLARGSPLTVAGAATDLAKRRTVFPFHPRREPSRPRVPPLPPTCQAAICAGVASRPALGLRLAPSSLQPARVRTVPPTYAQGEAATRGTGAGVTLGLGRARSAGSISKRRFHSSASSERRSLPRRSARSFIITKKTGTRIST